jgi:hypothetical protein
MDDTSLDVLGPFHFLVAEFAAVRRAGGRLFADGRVPTRALLVAVGADHETSVEGA